MNNNEMNFDPMTGQPINNENNTPISQQNIPIVGLQQETAQTQTQEQLNQNNNAIQQQVQNIPTVEQSKQEFIDNTQALNPEKKEEKKNGINYAFLIILFIIIFAAIFFLFPFLLKHI